MIHETNLEFIRLDVHLEQSKIRRTLRNVLEAVAKYTKKRKGNDPTKFRAHQLSLIMTWASKFEL